VATTDASTDRKVDLWKELVSASSTQNHVA
jgi:hypothetical protein